MSSFRLSRGSLICIVGVDGVGKTTHATLLVKKLQSNGIPTKYQHLRFGNFLSIPLLVLGRLIGLTTYTTIDERRRIGYHHFARSKAIASLYPVTRLLDMIVNVFVRVYAYIAIGKVVVCDRFVYDTIADIMVSLHDLSFCESFIARMLMGLVPSYAKVVLLTADPDKLRNRRIDVMADEAIELRVEIYDVLAKKLFIPKVASEGAIDETQKRILSKIGISSG